jgi:hypothetical protein
MGLPSYCENRWTEAGADWREPDHRQEQAAREIDRCKQALLPILQKHLSTQATPRVVLLSSLY